MGAALPAAASPNRLDLSEDLRRAEAVDSELGTSVSLLQAEASRPGATADDVAAAAQRLPEEHQELLGVRTEFGVGGAQAASAQTAGLCIRKAWGPGRVEWKFDNPKGAGYSVKPETSNDLVWASGRGQDIDGVYRSSWGQRALKVPDSATVTFSSSSRFSVCENAAMKALGHSVEWVNPRDHGWPANPL